MRSTLYIVGAGPGDPDLLTVKAAKVLQKADVVLYDALVLPEVLALCPPSAQKVCVGKRAGDTESTPQEAIHQLIVSYGKEHEHVVRLKGGDPFIYGRGQEEALVALAAGMAVEVVAGLSSVHGAPAAAGIPLTLRGVSDGYTVITATVAGGGLCEELARAFSTKGTVVILMGMRRLSEIAACCMAQGKGNVPAAIIQAAGMPQQQIAVGTSAQLAELAEQHQLRTPGIVVIGQVVAHRIPVHTERHTVNALAPQSNRYAY